MQLTERRRWKEIKFLSDQKDSTIFEGKKKRLALNILYADEKEVEKKGEIVIIPKINQAYTSFGL